MTDRDALYAYCEETPGDFGSYMGLSDLLRHDGWESLAHAFAWMAGRGVWPHKRTHYATYVGGGWTPKVDVIQGRRCPAKFRWAWYLERPVVREDVVACAWPKSLLKSHVLSIRLMGGSYQRLFASHQEAVMFLASQLASLKNVWDVEPPKLEPTLPATRPGRPLIEVLLPNESEDGL